MTVNNVRHQNAQSDQHHCECIHDNYFVLFRNIAEAAHTKKKNNATLKINGN